MQNLRAAGDGELVGHRPPERCQAPGIPVDQRAEIIDAYRRVVARTVERCFRSRHREKRKGRTSPSSTRPLIGKWRSPNSRCVLACLAVVA